MIAIHQEHPDHPGWFRMPYPDPLTLSLMRADHPEVRVDPAHVARAIESAETMVRRGWVWGPDEGIPVALQVPPDTEHPNHPGWRRVLLDPGMLTFARPGRPETIAVHFPEVYAIKDLDEQIADLVATAP